MKKFNDKIQELLNSVLKKSSPNEENIDVEDISDDAYIDFKCYRGENSPLLTE